MTSIISDPAAFNVDDLYVDLRGLVGHPIMLKCEGFNFAGSIKIKAAVDMVRAKERDGTLRPGDTLVESSSGNLGVALSMVTASRGYHFVCVTDNRSTAWSRRLMRTFGAQVHVVEDATGEGGLLGARLRLVAQLCATNDRYVWANQYANEANWLAHYRTTGPEIAKAFPDVDVLFIGAGTTGTLMGCARYFREHQPRTTVVAVDAVGSVTFGVPPRPRLIPGLGTGVQPPIFDESLVDDVVLVSEPDTVAMCRALARGGFLFGGSTGTVVRGAVDWLDRAGGGGTVAVAISPDLGDHYLETVYNDAWVRDSYGI